MFILVSLFKLCLSYFCGCLSLCILYVYNCRTIFNFFTNFHHPFMCLNVAVHNKFESWYLLILITWIVLVIKQTWRYVYDETKVSCIDNMWIPCISMWLYMCQIESRVITVEHLLKCKVLFDISINNLCYKLTMNHAWQHLDSPLVHSTK